MRYLPFLLLLVSDLLFAATYKVGVEHLNYYPAYNYMGKPSDASASKDILDDFAKKHGYKFEYVPLPVPRLYKKFLDGTLDFKFPDHSLWNADSKKSHKVIYSDPVFEYIDGLMVRDVGSTKTINDIKSVGTFRGFTIRDFQNEIDVKKVEAKYYDSIRELIIGTLKGSVKGAYLNIKVADYYLKEIGKETSGLGGLTFQPSLPHTRSAYHLSTLRHPKVMDEFNKYLKDQQAFVQKVIVDRQLKLP